MSSQNHSGTLRFLLELHVIATSRAPVATVFGLGTQQIQRVVAMLPLLRWRNLRGASGA